MFVKVFETALEKARILVYSFSSIGNGCLDVAIGLLPAATSLMVDIWLCRCMSPITIAGY